MTKAYGPVARANRKAKREAQADLHQRVMANLRAYGASCETCKHRERAPIGLSGKWHCSLGSDFHSFQIVKLTHLCTAHAHRTTS